MPESPDTPTNGSIVGASVTSVQKEYQQKFLQPGKDILAAGDADRQQLERLLQQHDPNVAKKFIRRSDWAPNHAFRGQLWIKLCKRLVSENDWNQSISLYRNTLPDIYKTSDGQTESSRSIPTPMFVDETMAKSYYLNENGRFRCRKILTMIETSQPQITYAPLIFPVAALFLHFIPDDAEVFACLDALLRPRKVPKKFMTDTVHAWKSSSHAMAELVRRRLKAVYNSLLHSLEGQKREELFDSWLKWIFIDLPFEIVIRVMDCYLYEGIKVLFRTGLALLKMFYKSVGSPYSMPNLAQTLPRYCQDFHNHSSASELLKVGFGFTRLSQEQLVRMIQGYEQDLRKSSDNLLTLPADRSREKYDEARRSISVPLTTIPAEIVGTSRILSEDQFYTLWQWLPLRHRIAEPKLIFTSEEHGTSLLTFFQQTSSYEPTLLLIKTHKDEVFGAFCSHSWENRFNGGKNLSYFGTGETFLFTLHPRKETYRWIGLGKTEAPTAGSSLFQTADSSTLIVGGGGGFAIRFDSSLSSGRSEPCTTFANPSLVGSAGGDFDCTVVESFGFVG
ncbi:hypothetical protein RvY_10995 [Ramazzottius varieornatus]|uniref:TLDc domain-containing protein n=1 Tax=Ramazzottius varieornatus TaxID=947166 RepID=A0A1D1VK31_RAMVA|nr:hypothetical protein RvY_10995 [Ramazzottius varieornatus]